MSLVCFAIFPVVGALISCLTALLCGWWLHRKSTVLVHEMPAVLNGIIDVPEIWEENQLDQKVEEMIKLRLDEMVLAFKAQIPMLGMFLGKAKEDQLKEQARIEFVKMIPHLKQLIVEGILSSHSKPPLKINATIQGQEPFERLFTRFWRSWTYSLLGIALPVGLIIGVMEALLISFFVLFRRYP